MADWNLYTKKLNINGTSIREREINSMKNAINNDFEHNPSFRQAYFNGSITVTNIHVLDEEDIYEKTVLMQPEEIINVGDVIAFDGLKWICVEAEKTNPVNQKGLVKQCNNILKVIKNQILREIPCIVSKTLPQFGIDETKYFSVPDGQILITVPNNADTESIDYNQVYKLGRNSYKIIGVNDVVLKGLLVLTAEFTTNEQHEIQEPEPPTEDLAIIINGSNTIQKGKSATYTAQVTQDGTIVSGKTVLFSLRNIDESSNVYATLGNQDGSSVVVNAGNTVGKYVVLKARLSDDSSVFVEKTIQIVGLF